MNLVAFPWWLATLLLGLSEAAEVAAITGAFGALSSLIAAYFGYKTMKLQRAARRVVEEALDTELELEGE